MDAKQWTNRYTVRKFSETNRTIPTEHIDHLETVLNNLPLQCDAKSDIWIYLDDSDSDIRHWLLKNIYWQPKNDVKHPDIPREYMIPVAQAPAMFLCVKSGPSTWLYSEEHKEKVIHELATRHEGMGLGVLLSEILNLGHKVGTFRCTEGQFHEGNEDQKIAYFTNWMWNNYEDKLTGIFGNRDGTKPNQVSNEQANDAIWFDPGVAVCFGPEAEQFTDPVTRKVFDPSLPRFTQWEGYDYMQWKIQGKAWNYLPKVFMNK